jgi:hypothetical protein
LGITAPAHAGVLLGDEFEEIAERLSRLFARG